MSPNGASSGAARFAVALKHKRIQADRAAPPAAAALTGATGAAAPAADGAAPEAAAAVSGLAPSEDPPTQMDANGDRSPGRRARPLQAVPTNAPARVRSAMAAALQYRQKQATDTAAAASAAATAAAAPLVRRRAGPVPAAGSAPPTHSNEVRAVACHLKAAAVSMGSLRSRCSDGLSCCCNSIHASPRNSVAAAGWA